MPREHFWYVDDEQHVRWAVRVTRGYSTGAEDDGTRIVFTSRELQLVTEYALEKDEQELSRYEAIELLAQAKLERTIGMRMAAA